jgi:hypothetical protein
MGRKRGFPAVFQINPNPNHFLPVDLTNPKHCRGHVGQNRNQYLKKVRFPQRSYTKINIMFSKKFSATSK